MLPELAPRALWLPSQPGQDSVGWAAGRGQGWEQKAGPGELAGRWRRWDSHSRDGVNPGFPISISAVLDFRLSRVMGQSSFLWHRVGPRQPRTAGEREGGASRQLERVLRSSLMPLWLRGLGQCLHLPEPSFPASASHNRRCLESIILCARLQWEWGLLVRHLI